MNGACADCRVRPRIQVGQSVCFNCYQRRQEQNTLFKRLKSLFFRTKESN